ncbi:hypothetical protein HMPREF9062_2323 [Actinomyces sp. oral taxon 448 str. F0400]|nr:hypothetical protein HMPREF9062_2323 [Actinomyces sp. oral taxon 448 str. F0400]
MRSGPDATGRAPIVQAGRDHPIMRATTTNDRVDDMMRHDAP